MKHGLENDTDVCAKILGYDVTPAGIKTHPNIDKDLYEAERILKPKKPIKGEFLCFK